MIDQDLVNYVRRLETSAITKPGMYLRMFHGRSDPEQKMDDWGDDGPLIGPLKWVHVTYNSMINICALDDETEAGTGPMSGTDPLRFHHDLLYYDGMYYGDWELEVMP